MLSKFGMSGLMGKFGGGGDKAKKGPGLIHSLTEPGMATHAAANYGAVLQSGQFGA